MSGNLLDPYASAPILFGEPAPPGELLAWSWARERLIRARSYWVASTRSTGAPHIRPMWGVWLDDRFWFSTGSLAKHNLVANPQITVHLENADDVVILEGIAERLTGLETLRKMCDVYNRKYDWTMEPAKDGVIDSYGAAGPAFRAIPRKVFGWAADMAKPTRWSWP